MAAFAAAPAGRRAQHVALAAGRHDSAGRGSSSSSSSSSSRGGGGNAGRAGRGQWRGSGGKTGGSGGGGRTGGGRGGGVRDPADDMSVCRTLEELQGFLDRRLAVWSERQDVSTMSAAFNLCGKLDSARAGAAATASARAGVIAALAPAVLPLVPRIRNPGHCSIVLWALAKAGRDSSGGNGDGPVAAQLLAPALLQRLADPVLLGAATPQNLVNALWALGKLREDPQQRGSGWDPTSSPHLATLAGAVASRLSASVDHGFKPQEISNSLWACAKLGYCDSGHVSALAAVLLQRLADPVQLAEAKPQELVNALWALAKLREDQQQRGSGWDPTASPHLATLAGAVTLLSAEVGHGFNPQDASNSLWACAKLGYRDSGVLLPLAESAAALAQSMKAQELANSLWSLGALSCSEPEYSPAVKALCGEALRRLQTERLAAAFMPQGLSNILIALEGLQLGGDQAALVTALAVECAQRDFAGFEPQQLSNSAWALAKMGYGLGSTPLGAKQQQWYAAAAAAAQRAGLMAGAIAQNWANLLYALALVRHQPPPALLDNAGAASAMQQGNGQNCANMLWALAVLQLRHGGVEAAVCGRLGELLQSEPESVAEQHLTNSLWALAVLGGGGGAASPPAAVELALSLASEAVRRRAQLTEDNLCQLWQAQRALGGEVAEALSRSPDLQAAMETAVAANRRAMVAKFTTTLQQQVVDALRRLQQQGRLPVVSVRAEVEVAGVLGPVDVVLDWSDGRQVAVEVDGPNHFFSNRQRDPSAVDGSTALRNRQLRRALGAGHVLCVPYLEWYGLRGRADQEAYLLRRLHQALQPPVQSGASAVPAAGGDSAAATTSDIAATAATARAAAGKMQKGRATPSRAVGGTAAADTPPAAPRGGQQHADTQQPQRRLGKRMTVTGSSGGGDGVDGGSSQKRILTPRRKAPPPQQPQQGQPQQGQQVAGSASGAGAGPAAAVGGAEGAAAAETAAAPAAPAGQQAQQRGPRRRIASVASSAGGGGGGGAGGSDETPPLSPLSPLPPQPQRGPQGVASTAARRSRRLAAPPPGAAVEIQQEEQLAADAPEGAAGSRKRRRAPG
ncbi:hypothetical protein HXX76_015190 [Chlamydomonas incerta]|uniref:RAP domain-containing protein n=1 Tax=Chlamydomonas incerta TaxID=51695 RepID=A0A835SA62_CHLIN|nr:hypothetical protein HXX76_015190 [Chlamydomonas incerta]|eukprot:KAG2423547.1 hypothetical protein HXX76_015190 [Chlamydomonas incerta]